MVLIHKCSEYIMMSYVTLVIVCVGVLYAASGANAGSIVKVVEDNAEYLGNGIEESLKGEWDVVKKKSEVIGRDIDDFFENEIPDVSRKAVSFVEAEGDKALKAIQQAFENAANGCQCIGYACGCCGHVEEDEIDLNTTICVNATYLKDDYGFSFTVTINNFTIFNETVSVHNPPPVCLGLPYVKEWAEACVRLYDIDTSKSKFHACVRVEARMKKVLIAKFDLGCFTIGPMITEKKEKEMIPSVILL